jgi:pilus assembly protein CpaB
MRSKSMFLMIACVCGAIAAVGASQLMQAQGTATDAIETVEIFVATRVINEGEEIKAEMMALEAWPADKVPPGASSELTAVESRFAGQKLYAGEPIINEKLLDEATDITVAIPKGFSVVSMKADAANSVANLVRPGDRVNVMAYFTKSDLIPETGVRTVLTGVKVFAVDGRTARDMKEESTGAASTVSLLIDTQDEEAWTYASENGRIRLSLGRPAEDSAAGSGENGGKAFLKWLADYQADLAAQAESSKLVAAPTTESPEPTPAVKKRAEGFKMLKLHGGEWTEYEFIDGKQVPVIKATSGSTTTSTEEVEPSSDAPEKPNEYSELNGVTSPFYEPSKAAAGQPLPNIPQTPETTPKGAVSGVDGY